MIRYNLFYMVFLVIVLAGAVVAVSVDFTDRGECRKSVSGDTFRVRYPGSETFVEKQYCIIIYS